MLFFNTSTCFTAWCSSASGETTNPCANPSQDQQSWRMCGYNHSHDGKTHQEPFAFSFSLPLCNYRVLSVRNRGTDMHWLLDRLTHPNQGWVNDARAGLVRGAVPWAGGKLAVLSCPASQSPIWSRQTKNPSAQQGWAPSQTSVLHRCHSPTTELMERKIIHPGHGGTLGKVLLFEGISP